MWRRGNGLPLQKPTNEWRQKTHLMQQHTACASFSTPLRERDLPVCVIPPPSGGRGGERRVSGSAPFAPPNGPMENGLRIYRRILKHEQNWVFVCRLEE
jgi:hypothetical protein